MKGGKLPDYSEAAAASVPQPKAKKGGVSGLHSVSFTELMLKPGLITAIQENGFEHPSEVQQEALPQAIVGTDIICQALSGMGKTAVFVLAVLQQLDEPPEPGTILVLVHSRELAFQINMEFEKFSKHLEGVTTTVVTGGVNITAQRTQMKKDNPVVVVGTPGRVLALAKQKVLDLGKMKKFVMDECDKLLGPVDMRSDVQNIFKLTPHSKQVMLFSATMNKDIRHVFRKFVQNHIEIFIDNDSKLTLHGLQQYYLQLQEGEKTRKLIDLLDALQFNQVMVFMNSPVRATELNKILVESKFPSTTIHSNLSQTERFNRYKSFKDFHKRILVTTDLCGRGLDLERVNIVINYDMPKALARDNQELSASNTYLHRVGRAGRFGTKGLTISFISSEEEQGVLKEIQERFALAVKELPESINVSSYSKSYSVAS